jgi:hypothetical protein
MPERQVAGEKRRLTQGKDKGTLPQTRVSALVFLLKKPRKTNKNTLKTMPYKDIKG